MIPDEEKKERGFDPNVTGEYVPAEDWNYDTPPEPNQPLQPTPKATEEPPPNSGVSAQK